MNNTTNKKISEESSHLIFKMLIINSCFLTHESLFVKSLIGVGTGRALPRVLRFLVFGSQRKQKNSSRAGVGLFRLDFCGDPKY